MTGARDTTPEIIKLPNHDVPVVVNSAAGAPTVENAVEMPPSVVHRSPEGEGDDYDDDDDDDHEMAAWRRLASGPTTPNITEAMAHIKRNLSIGGLQELANRPRAEVRRSITNKVWRPSDEKPIIPHDWERLCVHVTIAGSRAFMLAYGLRSIMSFLFALIRSFRSRKFQREAIRSAFLGEQTARFALTFGVWAALYKAVFNSLRLLTPPPVSRKTRSRAKFDLNDNGDPSRSPRIKDKWAHQRYLFRPDPRSKIWHAYVAGAVSSLALLIQDNSFYRGLAPQLFVRYVNC